MVDNAWQLLTDEHQWTPFSDALQRLAQAKYSPAIRSAAVRRALAQLGLAPRQHGHIWPRIPRTGGVEFRPTVPVPLRPKGVATPTGELRLDPPDGGDRYREWAQRYGPTDELLAAMRRIVADLPYQPTISILMPVYNTEPSALRAAVDSVRDQVYGRWQLCIADDGSSRRETLSLLEELGADPAISIVHLAGNTGISGATNAALSLADGEFVAFLDHDDVYKPHALAQVVRWLNADPALDLVYSDEDKLNEQGELIDPHIKPDWSPDHLMSNNYVCHLSVIRRSLVEKVGGLRSEYDGSQDYDLLLRVTEETHRIAHIPEPLYSWRIIPGSAAADAEAKPYAWHAGRATLADALARRGQPGTVEFTVRPGIYRSRYALPGQPKVSVIIPTKDRKDLLERCVDSIYEKTTYRNFDLTVIDNQSTDPATLGYLARFHGRVIRYPHRFNYPRMMNLAAAQADCDALLFLNNDMEVISPEWMDALLEHAMRPEIGAAGGRLYFGDGRIQHEGVFVGTVGLAANADYAGYWGRGDFIRNSSAVTGACMMIRPTVYSLVGGYDERLRMAYNDVDLCLRIRQAGFDIVYTPYAELYHFESATRSYLNPEDEADGPAFTDRWRPRDNVDDYYSPLFERDRLFVFAL